MPVEFLAPRTTLPPWHVLLGCVEAACQCLSHWERDGCRKSEHTGIGRKQNRVSSPKRWLYCRTSSQNFVIVKAWVQNGSGQTWRLLKTDFGASRNKPLKQKTSELYWILAKNSRILPSLPCPSPLPWLSEIAWFSKWTLRLIKNSLPHGPMLVLSALLL